jgi:hypothetical protein
VLILRVNVAPPHGALLGEIEERADQGPVIVKDRALDVPPPGAVGRCHRRA